MGTKITAVSFWLRKMCFMQFEPHLGVISGKTFLIRGGLYSPLPWKILTEMVVLHTYEVKNDFIVIWFCSETNENKSIFKQKDRIPIFSLKWSVKVPRTPKNVKTAYVLFFDCAVSPISPPTTDWSKPLYHSNILRESKLQVANFKYWHRVH